MNENKSQWLVASGQWPVKSGQWSVVSDQCPLPTDHCPLATSHWPLTTLRRGVTLVELLVVISIVVLLSATMLPRMRPAIEERRIREAARAVNTYISAARNRAIETGRPCGIMFESIAILDNTNKVVGTIPGATSIYQVEVPPPYGGDTTGATANVTMNRTAFTFSATLNGAALTGRVFPGDQIQFNYQGPFYTIGTVGASNVTGTLDYIQAQTATPYTAATPVPFKIVRRPRKAHTATLQLPAGTVIDLEASGTSTAVFSASASPIIITFSPGGGMERIYYNNNVYPAIEQVFLLIGRRERVPSTQVATGEMLNWQDLNNLWITMVPQSGMVVTGINSVGANFVEARDTARAAQTLGGK
jgi:prepilin-type N-terminal cleavage/methylation domain-containing protein